MSEILDIVDANDHIVGQLAREEIYAKNMHGFRTVNAFLVHNSKIWIPQRTAHKDLNPSKYDASVGGHVKAGESYDAALMREAFEELNVQLGELEWKLFAKLTPHEHSVSSHMHIYKIHYPHRDVHFNPDDFVNGTWLSYSEMTSHPFYLKNAKSDLKIIIQLFAHDLFVY